VIDLGLDRDSNGPARRPPDGRRFRWPRASRTRWAFAACLALVLLTVGEARQPLPSLPLVESQPPGSALGYGLIDGELFVTTGGEEPSLSVYRARDGRLLRSLPVTGNWVGAHRLSGGLVLLVTQPFWGRCCQVTAYDRIARQVRWSRQGDQVTVDVIDGLLAMAVDASTQVINVRSGQVVWQGGRSTFAGFAGSYLLLIRPDGIAERRNLRTGAVQVAARIHPAGDHLVASAIVAGQLVIVHRDEYSGSKVSAYDVDDLDLAWTRNAPAEGLIRCGPMICLHLAGLEAVEPQIGAVAWHEIEWSGLELGGQLIALTPDPDELRAVGVVDALTGSIVLDLRSWQVHPSVDPASPLVLTRASANADGTTVALVDLADLTIQVVGMVPDRVSGCQAGTTTLACRAADGGLRLWAYRR